MRNDDTVWEVRGKHFSSTRCQNISMRGRVSLFFSPAEQHHFTIVHSHLHSFFPHSAISPLFHLHARCEDHSSTQIKKEKHRRCWRRQTTTQVPLSSMTRYSYINVFSFPILSTLPKLSLTISSKCVHSSTSYSKRTTC